MFICVVVAFSAERQAIVGVIFLGNKHAFGQQVMNTQIRSFAAHPTLVLVSLKDFTLERKWLMAV